MCSNDRTRPYLPLLAEGNQKAFWAFYQECSPCAAKSAWESHEHDRTDCVHKSAATWAAGRKKGTFQNREAVKQHSPVVAAQPRTLGYRARKIRVS